jgi:hypothetical protein
MSINGFERRYPSRITNINFAYAVRLREALNAFSIIEHHTDMKTAALKLHAMKHRDIAKARIVDL